MKTKINMQKPVPIDKTTSDVQDETTTIPSSNLSSDLSSEVLLTKEHPSPSVELLPQEKTCNLQLATCNHQPPTIINPAPVVSHPCPADPAPKHKSRRKGRVASLPKLQRDMVNRMLWNGIPYKNIVAALDDAGYSVNERNISNWATGGYLEWRIEQDAVLEHRLDQDHLLDFLRRDDAPDLPEVGLQAAATRLSQHLLQRLSRADDPEANLDNYSRMVDILCRLNREISITQKHRDDSRRTLGREHDPEYVKDIERVEAIETERYYSSPPSDSELPKPTEQPLLPPIPTANLLADQAAEEAAEQHHQAELARIERIGRSNEMLKRILEQNSAAPTNPSGNQKT
jgi:hypothetical protein